MQKNNVYIFSQGYHNKLSQLQWLKIKEIYYFTVCEASSIKSYFRWGWFFWGLLREHTFHIFLVTSSVCQKILTFLVLILPNSKLSSIFTWLPLGCFMFEVFLRFYLIGTSVIGFKAHTKSRIILPGGL